MPTPMILPSMILPFPFVPSVTFCSLSSRLSAHPSPFSSVFHPPLFVAFSHPSSGRGGNFFDDPEIQLSFVDVDVRDFDLDHVAQPIAVSAAVAGQAVGAGSKR